MAEKRTRRSKEQVINDKIAALDEKIQSYEAKIADLKAEKNSLEDQLAELAEAAQKAADEEAMKEILVLMKKKGLSATELKGMLEQ